LEAENAIHRLMLFLLSAGLILMLNVIFVISGNADELWKNVHQIFVSLTGYV